MSEVATSSGDTSRPSGEAARAFEQPKGPVETFGVNCPTCGGSLCVHEGERSIRCEYCGSALYVTRPQGVRSFMMQPRITAGKARFSALRYLAEQTGGRVKARHASIIDLRLIQAPFWRMRGKLMGWVCGDKIKLVEVEMASPNPQSQTVHKTTREERIPYSKLVFKRVDWSTPACVLRHLGLQGISLRTGFLEWDIFDHELTSKHTFALPMKSIKHARKDAFHYLSRLTTPAGATVRASRFHLFGSSFSLYYYPVYFIRYRHGSRIYTITIDGGNGHIIRGDIPQRKRLNAMNMFFVPAAFAFLAGTYLPLAFIAAGIIYTFDLVTAQCFLPPHRWLVGLLNRWFGGEQ